MIFSFFLKVLSIIILITIIQSLYGVGILLFGTPLLLLFGLPFSQVLIILLPISFSISSIQIFRGWNFVRLEFVRLFILYTLPSTIISLSLILYYKEKINLNLYVEIKGYKTERDIAKWLWFPHPLAVVEKDGIKKIRKKQYTLELLELSRVILSGVL